MDRLRLIITSIILLIYLLVTFPVQTITVLVILSIAYYILTNLNTNLVENRSKATRRKNALKKAKMFLSPYTDIWKNLKLSNHKCELKLGYDGIRISARDKINPDRRFDVIHSNVHSMTDLWDLFCIRFAHNTSFDGLVEMCELFKAEIYIYGDNNASKNPPKTEETSSINTIAVTENTTDKKEKLDINNASEFEITSLPGISIVLAKKIIKRRDEIKGFKSVDEVCKFLNLRPHMEEQLRKLICTNKMKGTKQIKRYTERNIDL